NIICDGKEDTAQRSKLSLEQAVGVGEVNRFEGVAADDLCQTIGLVGGGPGAGPHFIQEYLEPSFGERPGRLRAGEASADHGDVCPGSDRHPRATSSGSATTSWWPHLRHFRVSPSALLIFFSMPNQPQEGQVSGT